MLLHTVILPQCVPYRHFISPCSTFELTHCQATAWWVPRAATLLVRSRLLEGVGGPYFGSVQGCDPLLTPDTKDTVFRIFGYD